MRRGLALADEDFGLPELHDDLLGCMALSGHEKFPQVGRFMPKEYRKSSTSAWTGVRGARHYADIEADEFRS